MDKNKPKTEHFAQYGHLVACNESKSSLANLYPSCKIIELKGEHPNIQSKIISEGVDWFDANSIVNEHNLKMYHNRIPFNQ